MRRHLFVPSCAVAVSLLLMLCLGAGASRHHAGFSVADASEREKADRAVHEPDFATIESIYKKGQLRSAATRRRINVDALPPESSSLGDLRLVWDLFYPDYNCPYGKSRHGRVGDGGKWICGTRRFLSKPGCVIYSLGSNAETSFETDVALETECEIHVFDPTQSSVPMPATHRSGNDNFHAYAIGNPAQNSTWQTKSLEAVMSGLGHAWIDVLKMDIEGGEWDFLEFLFKEAKPIPVGQVRFFVFCFLEREREERDKRKRESFFRSRFYSRSFSFLTTTTTTPNDQHSKTQNKNSS